MTLGVIIGNRDFFPDSLVTEARKDVLDLLGQLGVDAVLLGEQETKLGSVETWEDAKRCAQLFRTNASRIDGILVVLPNFGDEKAVADTIRLSGLHVPILVQAYPDDLERLDVERRRDAFCGKISVCNNLRQYGFPFTLTRNHTDEILSPTFREDLEEFLAVCRLVRGLRGARIGAIGARPNAFNTTRYSEKLLEGAGISVNTLDLSEVFADAARLADDDAAVKGKIEEVRGYADVSAVPEEALRKIAKLGVVIERWMRALDIQVTALQCWSSLQKNYGVNCCTLMSMMSSKLMPSACEVDVTGAVSMYALQLASGKPSALVDWNNNYGKDPNKCVLFHCGNWPKLYAPEARVGTAPILGTTLGEQNTYGTLWGRTPAGPVSFARVSTDDKTGRIRAYVAEGRFTDDALETFGCRAVAEVPALQQLLNYVCKNGFEHHVAVNASRCASAVAEAFTTYLGWETYVHQP